MFSSLKKKKTNKKSHYDEISINFNGILTNLINYWEHVVLGLVVVFYAKNHRQFLIKKFKGTALSPLQQKN